MTKGFREMLTERQEAVNSLVCVGLDPLEEKIPESIRKEFPEAGTATLIARWMQRVVDATAPYASMFKPQIAHWESMPHGREALQDVIKHIHTRHPGIPVFLDCKRGDIGRTQQRYRIGHLQLDGADGMNFSPYMGKDCMEYLVDKSTPGRSLVGLCYTSNPSSREVQDVKLPDGRLYWEYIAETTLKWAKELGVDKDAGLVMAAAYENPKGSGNIFSSHISRCREIVGDNMWFLIPGIGTQGGFVEETVKAAYTGPGSITINSSSGIIFASSDEDFAEAAANKARELRDQIRSAGGDVKSSSDNPDKGVNIDILEMGKEELLALNPDTVKGRLSKEEVLHIFKTLGGFWAYDHDAGKSGRPGYHALLKSGRHSDGFINSKVVLCHDNIRKIFARQITLKIGELGLQKPEFIAGIPEGATALGEDVAGMLGSDVARMEKVVEGDNKVIKMRTRLDPGQKLILVEDFCTKGTGFKEAVRDIASITKDASLIMPYELVILNRGGLKEIVVDGMGTYTITPLVEHRISDWDPVDEGCPLCKLGSKAIKPKDPLDNWELLMKSQDT